MPSGFKLKLTEILAQSAFDAGQQMGDMPEVLAAQTEALFKEFKGRFSELTLPEVREAFKMGVRGEFGAYFGFCPATYHKFLKSFYEYPERMRSWADYTTSQTKDQMKPIYYTPERLREIAQKNYIEYKETGAIPYAPHAIYNVVCEMEGVEVVRSGKRVKTLIPNDDEAREIFNEVKQKYLFGKKEKRSPNPWDCSEVMMTSFEFALKKAYLLRYWDKM